MTLDQILAHPIGGDASTDAQLMREIEAFVRSISTSVDDKATAIRHLAHRVMGLEGHDAGDDLPDSILIAQYLDEGEQA